MAERARKEVAERVAAIREKLLEERNSEIQVGSAALGRGERYGPRSSVPKAQNGELRLATCLIRYGAFVRP